MFIGPKEVKESKLTDEKTPGGEAIFEVEYADGMKEKLSRMMLEKVESEESCTPEQLREKRCAPVVSMILAIMAEWGVKLSELGYISALLNRSLDYNRDQALNELWGKWMPKPIAPDEVDLLTVDRVLKAHGSGIKDA